ncbi:MAG: dTMP kinase [Candidatus Brocadiia bacterium]
MKGRLIVFEGLDGCGKSTQMKLCAQRLTKAGFDVLTIREPGSTKAGEKIRKIILSHSSELDVRAELLLFLAARAQLCHDIIAPALKEKRVVLADRFLWSSAAYQGAGLGAGIDHVLRIGRYATYGIKPDLYIVFDIDPALGFMRRGETHDRIEARSREFFNKVRLGYRALVAGTPGSSVLLDGSRDIESLSDEVAGHVAGVLGLDRLP